MLRNMGLSLVLVVLPALAASGSAQDNEALLRQFYEEAVNQGHLELFDEMTAENFVEHEAPPGVPADREGVKQYFGLLHSAFADLRFDVEFTMVDGDKVAAYVTMSGTQKAEFMGVPSQGHSFSVKTIDIIRFENGKAVEHWGATDTGAMMQQLTGGGASQ